METLSKLMVNPIDAVSGMMEAVLPATPTATAAGSTPNATFTEDTLRMIMHNIFTGDSRLQGQMLSKYWSADATYSLNEGLMHLKDRDSLAQLLGGVTLLASVEPTVLEITSTTDRAVILLNLSISYRAVPLTWSKHTRVQVPTTLTLSFAPDPAAVIAATDDVITDLKQEMSLPDLFWWNPAWGFVNNRIWGPVSGQLLSRFVQLESPLVSRFQQYLTGGAGYTQAAIWLAEDAVRGMHGAPRHPVAPPPPSAQLLAAAAPDSVTAPAPPAAAAMAEGPSTPGRLVLPAAADTQALAATAAAGEEVVGVGESVVDVPVKLRGSTGSEGAVQQVL